MIAYTIFMPLYEYTCNKCGEEFEELVTGSDNNISCPRCGTKDIKKKFSLFGMSGVQRPVTSAGSGCSSCSASSCKTCK